MNISTALLLFLGWQFLSGKNGKGFSMPSLPSLASGFMNDDAKNLISSVSKLSSNEASGEDKMSAILQMMMNPSIQEFMNGFFGGGNSNKKSPKTNDEGYVYKTNPSSDAVEFFKPVENIAGIEASQKLYELYDNWFGKKSK